MVALLFLVCFITVLKFAFNGFRALILGCGRRFTKGRKCALNCPNSADCPFSKFYKDPDYIIATVAEDDKKEGAENV